jgi:antitoxin component YwqK of YwqJK toxin-antitoxin module
MNEQVKFARWVLIHTDEVNHTTDVCRYYENKLYTIDEIFDIYTNIQSKSENAELTPHIKYHPNGNVWIKGQKNSVGQHEGTWECFRENGNIRIRTPYVGGKMDGIVEEFYENGNIEIRTPHVEGKMDGIEEWFYPNGNIRWRTSYKEGKIDGIQIIYDERGNINETYLWKNGELIEETKH